MYKALRIMLGLVLSLGVLSTGGCGKPPAAGAVPAEVRIGYFANLTHAQAVLGVASGEFEKAIAPAKLKTRVFNAGPSLREALFANQIDIGYIGPGPVISAFEQSKGKGIVVLAGAAANGVLIVARKDSGIKTLADLKDKKLATPQVGNTQDISAKHYVMSQLKQTGVKNVVPIANAEQVGMMRRGEIDAAWAPEPWGSLLADESDKGAGAVVIGQEKDLWPTGEFTLTVVIVRPEFLKQHRDVVAKLLGVHHAWTARLQGDAKAYVPQLGEALFTLTSKRLPPGVLEKALVNVKFTDDPLEQTLDMMALWTYELGFAKEKVGLQGLVDLEVLRSVTGK